MDVSLDAAEILVERPGETVRRTMREASDVLKKRGNLASLASIFLFCLLVTFTWYIVVQLIAFLFAYLMQGVTSYGVLILFEVLLWLIGALLFFAAVMPTWLGRFRMAGRMCMGESPLGREALYYFTSWRRWRRSVLVGFVLAFEALLPAALVLGAFTGVLALYREVLSFYMHEVLAVLVTVFGFLLAIAASFLILCLTGLYLLSTAIAVGNEALSVLAALRKAFLRGRRNLGTILLFSLQSIWRLLLSLCTFGVLVVFWYAHHYILSYLRLSMALCKGDDPT